MGYNTKTVSLRVGLQLISDIRRFQRRTRHSEARAKALRARADYVLSLEAANATLQRYYLDDIADIMLVSLSKDGLRSPDRTRVRGHIEWMI